MVVVMEIVPIAHRIMDIVMGAGTMERAMCMVANLAEIEAMEAYETKNRN